MDVEKNCKNCTYFRVRKGTPNCSLIKQKVSESYYCKKFRLK